MIEPRRSKSRVTSSVSVLKRTGTSNSKPAVIALPGAGGATKVNTPVLVLTVHPVICVTPFSASATFPATGLVIVRV